MKILTVIGARPQFIKAASISRSIHQYNESFGQPPINEIIVHTGQHYDPNMSDVFFTEMQIPPPDYHLGVGGGSHGAMTGRMLEKIEEVILKERPDVVLVYGDTNSTLAGALAAVKLHIPVAHVESGLRSFNMKMPEEINRILTDQVSQLLFCPTATAIQNLENEGFEKRGDVKVYQVGDVMYDAVLFYKKIAQPTKKIVCLLEEVSNRFYLATVHRAENTDSLVRFQSIMNALNAISQVIPVIIPLHPRTQKLLDTDSYPYLNLIEPVGYFDMLFLLSHCKGVFTDSGGLQKEAYWFQKPCITLRDETEWTELVKYGCNTLVGHDYNKIINAEKQIKNQVINNSTNLYGEGNAGNKIIKTILANC